MKFRSKLDQPRCGCADHVAEVRGIVDLPVDRRRAIKLSVVEHVKGLDAEIQRAIFC